MSKFLIGTYWNSQIQICLISTFNENELSEEEEDKTGFVAEKGWIPL